MKAVFHSFLFYFIIPLLLIWIVVFQAKLFILPHQTNPSRTLTARAFDANIGHDHADLVMYYRTAYADNSIQYTDLIEDILNPYGIKLGVYERVSTKLYEDIFVPPGVVGYAKEIRMAAFELIRPEVMKSEFDIDFIGYFSSGALHSAPIVLNIINNVLLRVAYDNPNGRIMSLTTVNDPLPQVKPPKFGVECGVTCTVLAVMMSFAIAFLSHSCIILPMWERQNGMKHLQLMCGVHPVTYWVSNFIYDAFFMFSVVVIIVMIFNADYYQTFSSAELVGAIWIICTIYLVWSGMMFAYFMSVLIPIKYNGYNFLAGLHLFVGIIPIMFLSNDGGAAVFFRNVFVLFLPPFTITSAFRNYFDIASKRDTCRGVNDYIKKVCNVKSTTAHEHFIHKGHYTSETEQFAKVSMQDVDLAMCCDRICLPVKSCYKPPAAFNTSAETWDSTGLITDTIALFFQGFIYLGLLIMVERGVIEKYMQRIYSRFMNYREQGFKMARKSHDIYQESLAVQSKVKGAKKNVVSNNEVDLICLNLNKSTSTRILIQDFNLEAKSGQCIAILGGGGSGKTCIAKMIAGEMMPTRGNCYIHRKNLFHKRKDYLAYIGYCPQKTSLYTDFTGSQMCKLMGRLRGVPGHLLDTHAAKWLNVFGLEEVAHDKCKYYAQGMRQRLGAAMALIGGPSIILLDEPTTDVDPFARERFWSVIEHIQREGHTIILTTYSTEEAFSLAEKVVVIAAGNMQCVGSPENLQTKYGKGHTILFKLKHELILSSGAVMVMMPTIEEFKKKVQESFEHIDLLDEHDDLMMYFLRDARLSWAFVFRSMHALAVEYNSVIESFDVSESEIEDIFIFMTNKHHELDKPRRSEPQMLLQTRLKDGEGNGDGKQKQVRRSMNTKKRLTNIV
ncbi:unnamed protein product [Orchesella dallaii]|uniref:ABC transporter domain-containing protein n=1 Tax=Orchesella dallaii TaxID=48710 RepID=A0ABP1PLL1_9HEXA